MQEVDRMVQLRVMNSQGTEKFRQFISDCRKGIAYPKPNLDSTEFSEEFPFSCDINVEVDFRTKLDMAEYLISRFSSIGINREEITSNPGLWTWIAYAWFEFLAVDRKGHIRPGDDPRYIFTENFRKRYRHLIRMPYDMLSLHGKDASLLFLYGPVNVQGDFVEQALSRIDIYSNTSIVRTFTYLYFDGEKMELKRGAQSRSRPGNHRRLIDVLKQLELTYDLYSSTSEEIIGLLPSEFDFWRG